MIKRPIKLTAGAVIAAVAVSAVPAASVVAQDFDWRAHDGEFIVFLANQHPWTDGIDASSWTSSPPTPASTVDVQAFPEDLYFDKMEQTVRAADGAADVYFLPMDSTAFTQYSADAHRAADAVPRRPQQDLGRTTTSPTSRPASWAA